MINDRKESHLGHARTHMKTIAIIVLILGYALDSTGASLAPNLLRIRVCYDQATGERLSFNDRPVTRERLSELTERLVALDADQHIWILVDRDVPSSVFLGVVSMLREKGFRQIRVLPLGGRSDGISAGSVTLVIEYHPEIEESIEFDIEREATP